MVRFDGTAQKSLHTFLAFLFLPDLVQHLRLQAVKSFLNNRRLKYENVLVLKTQYF